MTLKSVRIAHLSDLHCDGTSEWENHFEKVSDCLERERPNLVLITGDSVDQPTQHNYTQLKKIIDNFSNKLNRLNHNHNQKFYIITVPGNHDYFYYGNNLYRLTPHPIRKIISLAKKRNSDRMSKFKFLHFFIKSNLYRKNGCHIFFPKCSPINPKFSDPYSEILDSILKDLNVAVFPLDSNSSESHFFMAAQGHIDAPLKQLKKRNDHFKSIHSNYEKCIKIILLHHHPLPVYTSHDTESLESLKNLKNAHQFLEAVNSIGANIVLHGHQHVSGLAQFRLFFENLQPCINISSCGSTAATFESKRELKIIDFTERGDCIINIYEADKDSSNFTLKKEKSRKIIQYGDIRKTRFQQWQNDLSHEKPISYMSSKTKYVRILEDGDALIDLSLEKFKWKQNILHNSKKIKEYLRADIGRIRSGLYEFGRHPLLTPIKEHKWTHNHLVESDEPEEFMMEFQDKEYTEREEICFKMSYPLLNGYTLTEREHYEAYCDWPTGKLRREETSSIEVHYPTELLRLKVKFPDKKSFPNPQNIHLEASDKKTPAEKTKLNVIRREYGVNLEETKFLEEKRALGIHPEMSEIEIIIRYPQPNVTYTLRWELPKDTRDAKLNRYENLKLKKIRNEILDQSSQMTNQFYMDIIEKLKFMDDSLDFILFGYKPTTKLLEVARYQRTFSTGRKLFVGRGVAGKAFRTRRFYYWEMNDEPMNNFEEVIPLVKPYAVLSLPLMYPRILENDWTKMKGEKREGEEGLCPVFGVLNILTRKESSTIQEFFSSDDNNGKRILVSSIYSIIGELVYYNYKNIL